jgi:phosphoenolpyruvate carboxykinase (GTP)
MMKVLTFLEHDVELCQPAFIHICDGSDEENRLMLDILIAEGIVQPLPKYENWYTYENVTFLIIFNTE